LLMNTKKNEMKNDENSCFFREFLDTINGSARRDSIATPNTTSYNRQPCRC